MATMCCTHIKKPIKDWVITTARSGRLQMYVDGLGMNPGVSVDAATVFQYLNATEGSKGYHAIAAKKVHDKKDLEAKTKAKPASAEEVTDLGESSDPDLPVGEFLRRRRSTKTPGKFPDEDNVKYNVMTYDREDMKRGCMVGTAYGRRKIETTVPEKAPAGHYKIGIAKIAVTFMKLTVCKEDYCNVRKQILDCKVQYRKGTVTASEYEVGKRATDFDTEKDCDAEVRKAATAAA